MASTKLHSLCFVLLLVFIVHNESAIHKGSPVRRRRAAEENEAQPAAPAEAPPHPIVPESEHEAATVAAEKPEEEHAVAPGETPAGHVAADAKQEEKPDPNAESPLEPPHNDTSVDEIGKDEDTCPFEDGRGMSEHNLMNAAFDSPHSVKHGKEQSEYEEEALSLHNVYRQQHCAPPVVLNETLCQMAHKLAHELAHNESKTLDHDQSDDIGENVWGLETLDPSTYHAKDPIDAWFNESKEYDPTKEQSATHYTQIVWKETKSMGIGWCYCGHTSTLYIVAFYYPPGNVQGEFAENVGCAAGAGGGASGAGNVVPQVAHPPAAEPGTAAGEK